MTEPDERPAVKPTPGVRWSDLFGIDPGLHVRHRRSENQRPNPGRTGRRMSIKDVNYTAKAVRARKWHPCDDYRHEGPGIRPGDIYVLSVVFPGHDANPAGPAPWAHRLCADCAQAYDTPRALIRMTASPQDAPSGDSLPSRSDAGAQASVSGRSEGAQRPVEADLRGTYVDHHGKIRVVLDHDEPDGWTVTSTNFPGSTCLVPDAFIVAWTRLETSSDAMFDGLERRAEG